MGNASTHHHRNESSPFVQYMKPVRWWNSDNIKNDCISENIMNIQHALTRCHTTKFALRTDKHTLFRLKSNKTTATSPNDIDLFFFCILFDLVFSFSVCVCEICIRASIGDLNRLSFWVWMNQQPAISSSFLKIKYIENWELRTKMKIPVYRLNQTEHQYWEGGFQWNAK